jgi:hypothetical protein
MTLQEHSTKFRKGQVVGDSKGQESTLQIGYSVSLTFYYTIMLIILFACLLFCIMFG